MECYNCGTILPDDALFCLKCGYKQNKLCPECQHDLPADAMFCLKCGAKINYVEQPETEEPATAKSQSSLEHYIPKQLLDRIIAAQKAGASQNERRVVTMLFCDLEGSTAAAEQLDPEDWAEIVNGAFEHLIKPVYKYEGVLARLMGDAILAFFGAPLAHEDDPERALLTALEISDEITPYLGLVNSKWGVDINFRIGINTGLVVVGDMGSDMRVEYTAMGDAINLASRMESTADPGTIQITENTHKLVQHLFEFEELGSVEVKGKSEPILTYRVIRAKIKRPLIRGLRGFTSPLIGRTIEFQKINDTVSRLVNGHGHILSVTAEVGVGKTRLIAEVNKQLQNEHRISNVDPEKSVDEIENSIYWLQGTSLSYQTNVAFSPFIDILTNLFEFEESDEDQEKYRNIMTTILRFSGSPDLAPFLANLIGVVPILSDHDKIKYLEPPILRAKTFDAILKFFQLLAKHKPLVLIFDDLHWTDASTIELLKSLVDLCQTETITIILLFRPNRNAVSWEFHEFAQREFQHIYTHLTLKSLDYSESKNLISNLLEIEGLNEEIIDLIFKKSDGNPLFIEEVIGTVIDQELIKFENTGWQVDLDFNNISVPNTLAGVLTARLDGLDENSKRISQVASVVGREFRFDILDNVYDGNTSVIEALLRLQKREMIIEKSLRPYHQFFFKHALTHEIAYNSLLIKRRRELHTKIAICFEKLDPANVSEISRHYYEAENYEKALPYLVKAANQSAKAYSNKEAIALFTTAKRILTDNTDITLTKELYNGLGKTYMLIGDIEKAVGTYHEMLELAKHANDHDCQVTALNQLGYLSALFLADYDNSLSYLDESEKLAKSFSIDFGLAENFMIRCNIDTATAKFEDAKEHLSEAALIGERLEEAHTQLFGMTHMANTYVFMTNFEDAHDQAVKTINRARELGDKAFLSELLTFAYPFVLLLKGDLEEAHNIALEGLSLANEIGTPLSQLNGNITLAEIGILTGDYEKAIDHADLAIHYATKIGIPAHIAWAKSCRKNIDVELGNIDAELQNEFNDILKLLDLPLGGFLGGKVWTIYGMFLNCIGEYDFAIEYFNKVAEVPNTLMYLYEPFALLGKVVSLYYLDRKNEAERLIRVAEMIIDDKGYTILKPLQLYLKSFMAYGQGQTKLINNAETLADQLGLKPILWKIQLKHAEILKKDKKLKVAETKRQNAKSTIESIKINLHDKDVQDQFVKSVTLTQNTM